MREDNGPACCTSRSHFHGDVLNESLSNHGKCVIGGRGIVAHVHHLTFVVTKVQVEGVVDHLDCSGVGQCGNPWRGAAPW